MSAGTASPAPRSPGKHPAGLRPSHCHCIPAASWKGGPRVPSAQADLALIHAGDTVSGRFPQASGDCPIFLSQPARGRPLRPSMQGSGFLALSLVPQLVPRPEAVCVQCSWSPLLSRAFPPVLLPCCLYVSLCYGCSWSLFCALALMV